MLPLGLLLEEGLFQRSCPSSYEVTSSNLPLYLLRLKYRSFLYTHISEVLMRRVVYFFTAFMLLGLPSYSIGTENKLRLFQDYANLFNPAVDKHYEKMLGKLYHEKKILVIATIFQSSPWPNIEAQIQKYYNSMRQSYPGLNGYAVIVYRLNERQLNSQFSESMVSALTGQNLNRWSQEAATHLADGNEQEMIDAMLVSIYNHYYGITKSKSENYLFGLTKNQFWTLLILFLVVTTLIEYVYIIKPKLKPNRTGDPVQRRRR